ncbi:hypothetical protein VSH64_44450 [Amycolatopsis rhabdoformis]|uniref:Short-chain dehydrogenase n=1 Tax=Amycolatopsis rhabdoformis TaxID=1448059 RepID=A0ABZ1I883_9PSEU|nr:hypothetical protein [Amycolatopsis rhabdoformis]WSE29768.1 hypothetical protein VSH64_44450 [Amycolatopsis rhabdoformis]
MPGGIRTNLQRHQVDDAEFAEIARTYAWKTTEQGASTSVLLAAPPLLAGVGGRYFEDNNKAELNVAPSRDGVAAHALDPEAATLLWEVSLDLLAR